MSIGTSLGAYFEDAFDFHSQNLDVDESMVKTPDQVEEDKKMNVIEDKELGGIEV
jgi:hypothetical protein